MKVFISSVISGFETFREAAARAIKGLGYEVVRAEDFGSSASSPQQACLAGMREADLAILLLGTRYGVKQASGLSATHEEYREARGRRPVLAFVQDGVEYEPEQEAFIQEVRQWEDGNLTADFSTGEDLRDAVSGALHRHAIAAASDPIDEREMLARAQEVIGTSNAFRSEPQFVLSLAPGPRQEILRPAELENATFAREIQQDALFGPQALFVPEAGTQTHLRADWLVLSQAGASIEINSAGSVVLRRPALTAGRDHLEFSALIEEDIEAQLVMTLQFAAGVLDRIDSLRRLSHVAIIAALVDVSYQPWRTRVEQARSPHAMTPGGGRERAIAQLTPGVRARAEIGQRADELARDLMVLLRRELRQ